MRRRARRRSRRCGPASAAAARTASRTRRPPSAARRTRRTRRPSRSARASGSARLRRAGSRPSGARRPAHQHVDADPVPDRHLVHEPSEVPLELGDAGVELVPAALEVDQLGLVRGAPNGARRPPGAPGAPLSRRGPGSSGRSRADARQRGHDQPPPKKLPVNLPPWHPAPPLQACPGCTVGSFARLPPLLPNTFAAADGLRLHLRVQVHDDRLDLVDLLFFEFAVAPPATPEAPPLPTVTTAGRTRERLLLLWPIRTPTPIASSSVAIPATSVVAAEIRVRWGLGSAARGAAVRTASRTRSGLAAAVAAVDAVALVAGQRLLAVGSGRHGARQQLVGGGLVVIGVIGWIATFASMVGSGAAIVTKM